ncbi:SET domain-containing protein SmydA-8 isoform X2 [Anastrepha ludens]|uniref:SET domain-containing protein SmydA-8 isoform X2 n=1 Tax=Anastrepha ludens TaxID=28586 RepID=UPI0023B1FAF5|nr:SET domain-containing protein SmydA-8 isoform X2 [Anastrepha ludens]
MSLPNVPPIPTTEVAQLIDLHLGELRGADPSWVLTDSPISGRGVFARRDIKSGELIFRESALLNGPTASNDTNLNTCTICFRLLEGPMEQVLCAAGCSLPICNACGQSERHAMDCKLFRSWRPKDTTRVHPHSLRILSVVRCYFLAPEKRKLLLAMQVNSDKYYLREVERAAKCFENFPQDKDRLSYAYHTVCACNTNAYEVRSIVDGHETMVRGLFALAGFMNHNCTPNSSHHFEDGQTIVVTAARDIAQGEEITATYTKILWNTLSRQLFLRATKHFVCSCKRCSDPTENGTYLSALFCREQGCKGIVIPLQAKTLQPDWRCLTCDTVFPHSKMSRYQDFALNTINNRINTSTVHELINFINEMCPRFCPPSNYVLVEAKLNVIWRMQRYKGDCTAEEMQHRDRYREEILKILEKLGAGDCTLKKLITDEIP